MSSERHSIQRASSDRSQSSSPSSTRQFDGSRADPTGIDGRPSATTPALSHAFQAAQVVMQTITRGEEQIPSQSNPGDQAAERGRIIYQRAIENEAESSQAPDLQDFSTEPRKRSLKGKARGILEILPSRRESIEENKTRFIERNIKKINTLLDEYHEPQLLITNIGKIVESCYNHGSYFNESEDDFRVLHKTLVISYNRYEMALKAKKPQTRDYSSKLDNATRTFTHRSSEFLKSLRSRLESLQTAQQTSPEDS